MYGVVVVGPRLGHQEAVEHQRHQRDGEHVEDDEAGAQGSQRPSYERLPSHQAPRPIWTLITISDQGQQGAPEGEAVDVGAGHLHDERGGAQRPHHPPHRPQRVRERRQAEVVARLHPAAPRWPRRGRARQWSSPAGLLLAGAPRRHRGEAGGRPQLGGVVRRLGQRLDPALGDEVAHVALEPADQLLALLLGEVGEVVAHGRDEELDVGRRDDRVHAVTPSRMPVTVVENDDQSSFCCLSWDRPAGVIP